MAVIRFQYADIKPITLKNKKIIKELIFDIFSNEGKELKELNYIFCSDHYLLKINKQFLKHDYFTDIITFDLTEAKAIVGEIYISVDRVKENAGINSSSFESELIRVIFHGALHLNGYKDKKKSEIMLMRQKEDYYLQSLQKKLY